jgi:hypothetical protein
MQAAAYTTMKPTPPGLRQFRASTEPNWWPWPLAGDVSHRSSSRA